MEYRFASEKQDYSDYASGRVFYALPGHPAFPVRLASEIFQRCLAIRHRSGLTSPCLLYDPCCGSAYQLSTLAYLHWYSIAEIVGSDIDPAALAAAERNLSLLTAAGLNRRITAINDMLATYQKASHQEAIASAIRFRECLNQWSQTHQIRTSLFAADATNNETLYQKLGRTVDIVLTDIPYGWLSNWQGETAGQAMTPVQQMLEALRPALSPESVVAIAADKQQKINHPAYRRVERFQVGRRQVAVLQPIG